MKKAMLFLALLLTVSTTFAQKESDKTLVKTMDPKGTSSINFDFRNKGIESTPWDEGFIRVELEITANFPEAVLAQLVKAGRYTLSSEIDGETFIIKAKNLDKAVSIGGTDLDDHVRIFIKTPGYYAVSEGVLQKNFPGGMVEAVVGRSENMKEATKMIKEMRQIKEKVDVQYRFVYKKSKDAQKDNEASKANPALSKEGEAGNAGFIQGKKKTLTPNSTLKEVEAMYGDIIIGGMSLNDFED
ncbi:MULTISPECIES: hypothetical protein [unclassified Aureispira]|uniref:hypothetical protein n=1 Tax=unclassified Aureispira TaxID=2649989 RepID=UPI000695E2AD|nr:MULTISPECIES: hypothetical protein [unclassified Aureispira]WMX12956.1 hypothetical protein QP953_19135 [Aureispira sp. CCB-E]